MARNEAVTSSEYTEKTAGECLRRLFPAVREGLTVRIVHSRWNDSINRYGFIGSNTRMECTMSEGAQESRLDGSNSQSDRSERSQGDTQDKTSGDSGADLGGAAAMSRTAQVIAGSDNPCKLGKTARTYGIEDFIARLGDQWEKQDGPSLREISRKINQKVLEEAIENAAGETPLQGEVENLHELLTGDDITEGERRRARDRLSKKGVNPAELEDDFISYKTVSRHLKNCENREKEERLRESDPGKAAVDRITKIQSRLEKVGDKTVEDMDDAGNWDIPDASTSAVFLVRCGRCGEQQPIKEVQENDGCRNCSS